MNDRRAERLLARLESFYTGLLTKHGFTRGQLHPSPRQVFRHWERRSTLCGVEWRIDSYDLWILKGRPSSAKSQVAVDLVLENGDTVDIHGGSVPWLLGGRHDLLSYPGVRGLLLQLSEERLLETIEAEAERSLWWFEDFETPAKCAEQLGRGDRNGVPIGSQRHATAMKRLSSLASLDSNARP